MVSEVELVGLSRWRCIGPFRGGRVVAVSGSSSQRETFYFGGCAGGVWKTTDGGRFWRNVSDGFFGTSAIGALEVAPSDANVIYAGTGETTIRIDVSHGDGVYKSTDAGTTWRNMGLRDTRFIGKIRVHPTNPDVVWVAALGHAFGPNAERGVFKSTDGGENWRKVLFVSDKAGAVDLSLDPHNPRKLFAAVWEASRSFWQINSGGPESGLWSSHDGGESWTDISRNTGLPAGTLGKIGVAVSPAKSGRVWALIEHAKEGGLYRSENYGESWQKVSDNQNLLSRAWYYTHITADPTDAETVYVNNLDFHRSTDGGRTFSEIATPHGDNHDLWIDPNDNRRMIQGNDGGANVSFDGGYSFSTIYNQPTAQFYHLATDSREPYYVYGTQQDNSSLAVISRSAFEGIGWSDCFIAGSGESGYIVVRPDDPDIIYTGAIGSSPGGGNSLQRYDHRTKQIRLITTWPEAMRGRGAGEYKYRFAWTYPIVISPHDPNTLFIGGNVVFKSTNEGQSWQPISGDLSRADPATLLPTGGPVNRDSVGAEVYATVFALVESTHQAGVLWAGTDDGRLHLTKNGGERWTELTVNGLPERSLISGIELSPFDAKTAYLAATRYKLDDYEPYLFVTRDEGKSWKRIDAGIPRDDFTRVIRADPEVRGLLYAGTETGVYVSTDDGASWSRFQLNLPVTPIHDLLVRGSDLIAGTHGRSIWILDDLTPLREVALAKKPAATMLVAPRPTVRVLPGVSFVGNNFETVNYSDARGLNYLLAMGVNGEVERTYLDAGANPPAGAVVTYRLAAAPKAPITLTFTNAHGEVVRTFTSRIADDPAIAKELRAPANVGWNRFVWDLRHERVTKITGSDPVAENTIAGPFVVPGSYTVTLKADGKELTRSFMVIAPPVTTSSQADLDAQYDLAMRIYGQLNRTAQTINRMRDVRSQLDGWATRTEERNKTLATRAIELREAVLAIEKELAVPDCRPGWADSINHGIRLFDQLSTLTNDVQMGDYRPTDAAEEAFADFTSRIERVIARFDALVENEIPPFNKQVSAAKLGAVVA